MKVFRTLNIIYLKRRTDTVESRFSEPPKATKRGLKDRVVLENFGKITMFD